MDRILREAVTRLIEAGPQKRLPMETILAAIRRWPILIHSDFELRDRLLDLLWDLAAQGQLRLPAAKRCWDRQTGLPHYVTAVRAEAAAARQERRQTIDELRNATAWEPVRMVAFAHTLKDIKELKRARQVNQYLLNRRADATAVPHRERALEIFGDEKALDHHVRQGLFGGRITLADLDCFYCPEPLPFHPLSLDRRETYGKPLLVVENSNTYWSCCQANETLYRYAAIVYGQGFQVCAAERASDGLLEIVTRLGAAGISYFGDLDPTGIAIPFRINGYRMAKALAPLCAERLLYKALLQKNLAVPYTRTQEKDHDPDIARCWLGEELAATYLENALQIRWPQEGLTASDIIEAISKHSVHL